MLLRLSAFVTVLFLVSPAFAQSDLPLLEEYNFQLGNSGGNELLFHDPQLSNGRAQFRFHLQPVNNQEYRVRIEVFRHFIGDIAFALILERIEIQFLDAANTSVKSIVLDESLGEGGLFLIGDSDDGYFEHIRRLTGMGNARSIRIRLFGNYE